MTPTTLRELIKRRRSRGAAMVESAIIAGFMVILFACLWAAASYHSTKIRVMDEARAEAWKKAIGPCQGAESIHDDLSAAATEASSPGVPSTKSSDDYVDLQKTSLAVGSGYVAVEKEKNVQFPGLLGGSTFPMKGRMRLRCNEPEAPETAVDFFKQGFAVLKATSGF